MSDSRSFLDVANCTEREGEAGGGGGGAEGERQEV